MLNTLHLQTFIAVVEAGNYSAAAERLHMSQPAVSQHIRALEDALGRPLFVRDGRGLALTSDGHRLRDSAGEAVGVLQAGWTALQRGPRAAALVLGCPGSLLARWVIPRLERLAADLPDLTLHLSAQEGSIDLAAAGLDAALLLGEAPWPAGRQVWPLAPERIGPVLSPRHARFAALRDGPPRALLDEPLLHTASRPQAWPRWLASHQLTDAPRLGTGFDHLTYLLEAAVAGLGVAIAPRELVQADLDSGRLVAPWGFADTGGTWALCAARGNPDARIPLLADWLRRDLLSAD